VGMKNMRPMIYSGQRSKSFKLAHNSFEVIASRLCIDPLLGSSRIIRFTNIISSLQSSDMATLRGSRFYLSVNHPFFPLRRLAVCVGLGGISTKASNNQSKETPCEIILATVCRFTSSLTMYTSMKNSHLQPALPSCPLRRKRANPKRLAIMSAP
jgi:hypothetical protein